MTQATPNNPHEIARQQEDAARVLSPFDQRLREAEAARRAGASPSLAYVPVDVPDILKRNEKGDES